MIRLVGPGSAGKTTVGLALAKHFDIPFVDLDEQFTIRLGDISSYLSANGYQAYAHRNIQVYLDVLSCSNPTAVFALSSGFMTYAVGVHPEYLSVYREVLASPSTVVLLPSFDCETCVSETLRRQLTRPFSRSADREEQVIRTRFRIYSGLPTKKVETAKPMDAVVEELAMYLVPTIGG